MLKNFYCWSDLQILLWWIKKDKKDWKTWIENLVQVVRKNVRPECWMYIYTSHTPAGIATRILWLVVFVSSKLWWKGLEFLGNENIKIPRFPEEVSEEEKVETVLFVGSKKVIGLGVVLDYTRFESLITLLWVINYVWHIVENLKVAVGIGTKGFNGELSSEEMHIIMLSWTKYEQPLLQAETKFTKIKHSFHLLLIMVICYGRYVRQYANRTICRTRISSDNDLKIDFIHSSIYS